MGKANLSISRDDEHVHLPPISAEFLVVETLDAVSADLLVGLDIISSAGGVRLDYGEEPGVLTQVVFGERPVVAAASEAKIGPRSMPRHVTVEEDELKVLLKTDDGEAMFDKKNGVWEVGWKWKSGEPPTRCGWVRHWRVLKEKTCRRPRSQNSAMRSPCGLTMSGWCRTTQASTGQSAQFYP